MTTEAKPYLSALKTTIVVYFLANIIGLVIEVIQLEDWSSWKFRFENGVFFVNDQLAGLKWGETHTAVFLSLIFLASFFYAKNKQAKTE